MQVSKFPLVLRCTRGEYNQVGIDGKHTWMAYQTSVDDFVMAKLLKFLGVHSSTWLFGWVSFKEDLNKCP